MKERLVLRGHADAVSSLSWSPDSNLLASASWDKTVRLWDLKTGGEMAALTGGEEEVLAVTVSPDGQSVAAGGSDWNVRLWECPQARTKQLSAVTGEPSTASHSHPTARRWRAAAVTRRSNFGTWSPRLSRRLYGVTRSALHLSPLPRMASNSLAEHSTAQSESGP
jgi:WD40 repeat protein